MKVTTTGKAKQLLTLGELPKKAQSDFDYIGEAVDTPRFVKYRQHFYDVYDTQRITVHDGGPMGWAVVVKPDNPLAQWEAIVSETYFSGVVFRINDDGLVICGSYSA